MTFSDDYGVGGYGIFWRLRRKIRFFRDPKGQFFESPKALFFERHRRSQGSPKVEKVVFLR